MSWSTSMTTMSRRRPTLPPRRCCPTAAMVAAAVAVVRACTAWCTLLMCSQVDHAFAFAVAAATVVYPSLALHSLPPSAATTSLFLILAAALRVWRLYSLPARLTLCPLYQRACLLLCRPLGVCSATAAGVLVPAHSLAMPPYRWPFSARGRCLLHLLHYHTTAAHMPPPPPPSLACTIHVHCRRRCRRRHVVERRAVSPRLASVPPSCPLLCPPQ